MLAGFIQELREAGLPVSLTENLDAMAAVRHIPLDDREAFKYALAATLVKNNQHWRAFETVFEVYFSLRGKEYAIGDEGDDELGNLDELMEQLREQAAEGMQGSGGGDSMTPEELAELLYRSLLERQRRADARGRPPSREAVRGHGARAARRRDVLPVPDAAEPRSRRRARAADGAHRVSRCPTCRRSRNVSRRDEYEIRIDQLRKEIEAEIRRRLVADRGVEAMARTLRKPLPEDIDFMHASREEMFTLRRADLPAHPQARGAPRPQAPPRPQGRARLPQHRASLAVVRRRAGRAEVQVPTARRSPRSS